MGRLVKIWDMGTKGDSNDAYRAPNGKYYSTKTAYDELEKKKEDRKSCIDLLCEIFGYEKGMKPNTYIFKLLYELEPYGYDVLYETITQLKNDIEWVLSKKKFGNETGKIKYVFAMINNNVKDVYDRHKEILEQERKTNRIVRFEDYVRDENYNIGGVSGKGHDVSGFLGDIE